MRSEEFVKNVNGKVRIIPPDEDTENVSGRTVVLRCRKSEDNKISNPPLEEVLLLFQK